eukprot:TRINITY_DN5791_c0_g1_i4.p1 TRINITY_DN5791_c0_g1~~TRINITY_DN5791_c0_g1_i4.p1  ORF type:complete len:339 (-),score=58.02 TRINITY_DN5791_c0_g1_i4:169-1185(-)
MAQRLPRNPHLWSPEDVAAFLSEKHLPKAAEAVLNSIRLHSFDEVDGPRVLRDGAPGLQTLGVPARVATDLITEITSRIPPKSCQDAVRFSSTQLAGALWGIFIADALAAPVHWYYDLNALAEDYGQISHYVAPLRRHSGNRIMNNHWRDNKHNVQALVMGDHILHGKAEVWDEPYRHYHDGYAAGENTLNSQVARVAIRTVIENAGEYNPTDFLENYRSFMTTPGSHNDSYAEAYHRQFFDNYLLNAVPLGPECAGAENHDTPSIGGFVSALPVLLMGETPAAVQHMQLTHRSARLGASLEVYARAMRRASQGEWPSNLHEAAMEGGRELGLSLIHI